MKRKVLLTICTFLLTLIMGALCLTGCIGSLFGGNSENSSSNKPKTVKVVLDTNGGSGVSQTTLIGVAGEPMTLETPTREGFRFDRWYNGYGIVDNTVFPEYDLLLTARYYSESSYEETTSYTSPLNERYGRASGAWNFRPWEFDEKKVAYLLNNTNTQISIVVNFEAYCSTIGAGTWMGAAATMTLTGSSQADVFDKVTINNYYGYENFILSAQTTSAKLVGTNDVLFNMVYKTNLGSTECYYRNVNASITYTVQQGTLV